MASPFASVRRLGAAMVALLLARAEFASLELAQTREQLLRWVVLALFGAVFALLALIAGSALLAVVLWPKLGWITLAGLTAIYGLGALWLLLGLRREIDAAPPVLAQTLRELSADRDALRAAARRDDGDAP
jgi:uncharacterized membrane protein YqjE